MLQRADSQTRTITTPVGWVFAAYSLVSLARIPVDLTLRPAADIMKSDLYDSLVILIYEMLFIALTFALLLMRNRHLIEALEHDIVERRQVEHQLRSLSIHDALTGLYNRLFFDEALARLERERRFPVSILMADVDELKDINDRSGHAAGDAALKRVAQVLTAAFRDGDIIARIGGDEFAVLLPDTDAGASAEALLRVRQVLKEHNGAQAGMHLGLSFGMGTAEDGELLEAGLHRADANMYRKKRGAHRPMLDPQ
jgi:diguanylate cyclase (GGDEF)-like protein